MRFVAFVIASLAILGSTPAFGQSDEVRLKNGDILRVKIIEATADMLVVEHASLGRLSIPRTSIESYTNVSQAKKTEADEALEEELKSLEKRLPEAQWKGLITLGGSLTNDDEGEKIKFNVRARAERTTEQSYLLLTSGWIWEVKNDELDENSFNIQADYTWRREKKMRGFFWSNVRYDYDDFRSWSQRLTAHLGPGWDLARAPGLRFSGLIGGGFRKEWGSPGDPAPGEIAVGLTLTWTPRERQKIEVSYMFFAAIDDENSRSIAIFDWSVLLDRKVGMSFNTHLYWEWDTNPEPGFPENTIRWTWGLQFQF